MIPQFEHIHLQSVGSTNTEMKTRAADLPDYAVISAAEQTAGRGQRGNSWEAAPGENVTMSMLLRPKHIKASEQFYISQIVALAVASVLRGLLRRAGAAAAGHVAVKWPNDIYVGDRKICGMLIENTLSGRNILHSVAGIGLNVNQRVFVSDAPNPVSLYQLTDEDWDVDEVIGRIVGEIMELMSLYDREDADMDGLRSGYADLLWRRSGLYPYVDNVRHEEIMASVQSVAPDGMLTLRLADGSTRTYAFKEVAAIL